MTLFSLKEPCPQFVRRKPLESRKTLINQGFFGYRGSFPLKTDYFISRFLWSILSIYSQFLRLKSQMKMAFKNIGTKMVRYKKAVFRVFRRVIYIFTPSAEHAFFAFCEKIRYIRFFLLYHFEIIISIEMRNFHIFFDFARMILFV